MDDAAPVAVDGDSTATLLVVDDVEENRDILVRRLRRDGYTMLAAATGEEALARVAAGGVDLVLLDIMMPGMDGFEVLRRLRADPASADLPVVMVTAKDEGEDLDRAFELGADDHIAKPVNIAQCRARVKKVLRRRSPTDAKRGALFTKL
ncbi:MAG: response regulator, partial [Acidobacteriota bacterium]